MKVYYKIIDGKKEFFKGNVLYLNNATIVNPSHEQMLENGWIEWLPSEQSDKYRLSKAKSLKLSEIDNEDAMHEVFVIDGNEMWLGHELRQQIKTSVDAYVSLGMNTMTKWFDGKEFTFDCETWLHMLALLEIYASEVLNATEKNKALIMAMNDIDEIEQYDVTQGYPEIIHFEE